MPHAPTAKRIVLELMSVADQYEASIATLIPACAVLGVGDNSVRVALARLVAAGTVEPAGRGRYRLGRAARAMTRQVTSWREVEKQVRRWDGSWACAHLGALSRTDRGALRRRDRALRLLGFRALERDLVVRPDNLVGGVGALRERLYALGLEATAPVFRADELDAATEARARALWAGDRLSETYIETCARIDRWLVAVDDLEPRAPATPKAEPPYGGGVRSSSELRAAAREAFFFGGDVLRAIVYDPRLPEPLVDVGARRAMVDAAKRLDATGRRLWARLFGVPHGLVITEEHGHDHVELS